jgi:protein SCO1
MNFKFKYYWILLIIPAAFISWFFNQRAQDKPIRYLPYYGPKYANKLTDTSYHTVTSFKFINQDNEEVNETTFKNTIYVTEYFFTTCKTICPIMNTNLIKVYQTFKHKPDFKLLSHTVDPETDSAKVLKEYAINHGVTDKKWLFVTGSKKELYAMARKSYLLNAEQGSGDEDDFIHTQNFALIDREKHIRGFYDGTDNNEIERLITDINLLYKEYEFKSTTRN